jgi:L-rhamnose mutarotase
MKRYGSVIKVKPEALSEYKRYHAAVWPDVLEMIKKCNIRNYSIYLKDDFLFGYFEYHGTDYKADMASMAADKRTQEWWAEMEEVFHTD